MKREHVARALNEAEVGGFTDAVSLLDLLSRHPGHRGVAMLRDLLAEPTSGIVCGELEW